MSFFKQIENNVQRKDDREGTVQSILIKNLEIELNDKFVPLNVTKGNLNVFDTELYSTRVFCLFAITPEHVTGEPFVDDRNLGFGKKMLFIHNVSEFLKRIQTVLNSNRIHYALKPIHYYDDQSNQNELTVFHKPMSFQHQSEFRLHINEKGDGSPYIFKIGSMQDISQVFDASVLPKLRLKELS